MRRGPPGGHPRAPLLFAHPTSPPSTFLSRPLVLPPSGIDAAPCRGPRRTAPPLHCTADAAPLRCAAGSGADGCMASARGWEIALTPRCMSQLLGRVVLVGVSPRRRRITHFQAKGCRDGSGRKTAAANPATHSPTWTSDRGGRDHGELESGLGKGIRARDHADLAASCPAPQGLLPRAA